MTFLAALVVIAIIWWFLFGWPWNWGNRNHRDRIRY